VTHETNRVVSPARTLAQCASIADLQRLAQRRLPAPAYHYLEGGADDECTLRRNVDAFDDYELWPTYLKDIGTVDLSASLLGRRIGVPFFLAPTGLSRLFHHEKEPAVARAAQEFGTYYTLSTMGTTSIEAIGELGAGPWMFQIYILKDRGLTREFVERCRAARYHALCLTVDTQVGGNRERDRVTGMVAPPRLTAASLASFALHPRWSWQYLRHPGFTFANVAHRVDDARHSMSVMNFINAQFDRTLTWTDVEWLIREWRGPLVIKGLQSPADAKRAVDVGAAAIMISNHGGRQLDTTPAPVDCVAPIRDAVGDAIELFVDGGIRRGTHIVKALALGADACSIGRAYLYGLAAGGHAGVRHSLALLRSEVERSMALLGAPTIAQIEPGHVAELASLRRRRPSTPLE
jgi:L-lactate dehydrogenase (cytochrome)